MATKNLHQRLHAAMQQVSYIQREKKQGMRYSIVSHDAVTAKVRPALVQEGIVYYPVALAHSQNGNRTEVAITVRFVNVDDPADCIDVPALGYGVDDADKGPGKAISYAVKYALLKALGMESGDDPDEDQDAVHRPAAKPAVKPAAHPTPAPQADTQSRERAERIKQAIDDSRDVAEVNRTLLAYAADLESLPAKTRGWLEDRAEKRRHMLAQAPGKEKAA